VTVAVLDPDQIPTETGELNPDDVEIIWFSGKGKGGQHRNKHQNACRVWPVPTGLNEARQGRERGANLRDAMAALERRLVADAAAASSAAMARDRKAQRGSGMRGDKIVTIRFQDDRAQHHGSGKTMKASRDLRGFMDDLWQ
jgi:peptide chain release factor 1